jgi:bacteriocin-like protein
MKEIIKMSDKKVMNNQELENVSGGMNRVVNTGDERNAAVRVAPGVNNTQIGSLPNGTMANATGRFASADGRNWAEIDYPVRGWIKASILGYDRY